MDKGSSVAVDLNRLLRNLIDVLVDMERGRPEDPVIDLGADLPNNRELEASIGQVPTGASSPNGADHGLLADIDEAALFRR